MGCNTAILYHLLQKSTSTLNLKHMYIVQCTIYNTKCRNAHCKKNLLIILVHPTSFISWVSFYFTNIHESHNKSYRVWEKKFESSNTPHIHMKLTFSWPNYFNFHYFLLRVESGENVVSNFFCTYSIYNIVLNTTEHLIVK